MWSYGVFSLGNSEVEKVCHHFYENVVGDFWPPERRMVEAGYGQLKFPFREITAPPFEMKVEWSLEELLGYLSSWSATVRYTQARGASPIPELENKLRPLWSAPQISVLAGLHPGRAQLVMRVDDETFDVIKMNRDNRI